MVKPDFYEITIWAGGDEGRLWEWRRSSGWRVFEYYNYRHTFEESAVSSRDIVALRKHFGISDATSNTELLGLSPDELSQISQNAPA